MAIYSKTVLPSFEASPIPGWFISARRILIVFVLVCNWNAWGFLNGSKRSHWYKLFIFMNWRAFVCPQTVATSGSLSFEFLSSCLPITIRSSLIFLFDLISPSVRTLHYFGLNASLIYFFIHVLCLYFFWNNQLAEYFEYGSLNNGLQTGLQRIWLPTS